LCTVRLSVRLSQSLSQHEIGHHEATHVITDRSCFFINPLSFGGFLLPLMLEHHQSLYNSIFVCQKKNKKTGKKQFKLVKRKSNELQN
jgi:hypothetical protein